MKDRSVLARGWFRKGDSDLVDARRTTASEGPYDTACFHAQQAVEKYLKVFSPGEGWRFPEHTTWRNFSVCAFSLNRGPSLRAAILRT